MLPEKSPENFAFITYLWVFGLAMLGGLVSYLKKLKAGKKWKVADFLIEIVTSAFAGIVMFYFCEWVDISQVGTAALVGVSGHFSSKSLTLFGKILDRFLSKIIK